MRNVVAQENSTRYSWINHRSIDSLRLNGTTFVFDVIYITLNSIAHFSIDRISLLFDSNNNIKLKLRILIFRDKFGVIVIN